MAAKDNTDKGWAWVVLAACSLRAFLVLGIDKAFGLLFVEYIQTYDSNSSVVSSIMATKHIMFSLTSFLVLTVGTRYFTFRPIIILGSFLMAAGYFLNAFAPNVYFLFFSHGLLVGIGQAACSGTSVVMLNTYFDKRRGLANSLANSGGSLGGLLLPMIIQALLETYGLFGAQIVVSGLLLNIVVAGALMRPLDITSALKNNNLEIPVDDKDSNKNGFHDKNDLKKSSFISNNEMNTTVANPSNTTKPTLRLIIPQQSQRSRTISENLHEQRPRQFSFRIDEMPQSAEDSKLAAFSSIYGSFADITTSIQSIFLIESVKQVDNNSLEDAEDTPRERDNKFCRCCLKFINFSILKNHYLKCVYLTGFLTAYGAGLQLTYIAPYARDHDISGRNISYLVTIIGVCDFVGRLAVAWVADSKRIKQNHIISFSVFIVGLAAMLNSFLDNFPTFVAFSAIYGLFGTMYFVLLPILLVDAVGPKHLSTALAFNIQINGISISGMAPILGLIRDKTGSYETPFYIMGLGCLVAAMILIFVAPLVKKIQLKREKTQLTHITEDQ